MAPHDRLLGVIGRIYGSVGDPDQWAACLASISELFAGTAANLLHRDHIYQRGSIVASTISPECNAAYASYFHTRDPWALRCQAGSVMAGDVRNGESWIAHTELKRTEFYGDFGRQFDIARTVVGFIESGPGAVSSVITINRSDAMPAFDDESVTLMTVLVPHLQRALALHRRLVTVDAERSSVIDALDRFRAAVFLVSASLRVVLMNAAARKLIAGRNGLEIDDGHLRARSPELTTTLTEAIAAAVAVSSGIALDARTSHLLIPRHSEPSLDVSVLPLPRRDDDPKSRPAAAVFVTDLGERVQLPNDVLAGRYGLTPVEARVARALAAGRTIKDIAETLRLTTETTRWYVKQVLAKTGSASQAQVVRLLLSITAALLNTES